MTVLLQRLCWNNRGWTEPSPGRLWKEDSYVGDHGFGHEDWNFSTRDAIAGWVYGYIYQSQESTVRSLGEGPHRVYFWARKPNSSQRFLVGAYRRAAFVPPEERARVLAKFRTNGTHRRRIAELYALDIDPSVFKEYGSPRQLIDHDFTVSLAARIEDVRPFDPMIPLECLVSRRSADWRDYHHYTNYVRFDGRDPFEAAFGREKQSDGLKLPDDRLPQPKPPGRSRVPETGGLQQYREYNLTCRLLRFLQGSGRKIECVPFQEFTDVIASRGARMCLLELKSCANHVAKLRAREALGQLLYYSYHTGARTVFSRGRAPDIMCIVLDKEPDISTRKWVRDLRQRLGVDLDIMWERRAGEFSSEFGWVERL